MPESAHFVRVHQLVQIGRHRDAADALRRCIAEDPDEGLYHALLANCLAAIDQAEEALAAAEEAVRLEPESDLAHHARAVALHRLARHRDAELAALRARELDAEDPDNCALLSLCRLQREDHRGAEAAAREGLALDPEHQACVDQLATALTLQGRSEEADRVIGGALARDPDDDAAHANQGWALLHRGRVKEALAHFEEALRLDPENEWARAGMVEAIKAKNPVYRLFLAYALWMIRLPEGARWAIIIGGYIAYRVAVSTMRENPDTAVWLWPVVGAYLGFVALTWFAPTIFDLLLLLHPRGRHALAPRNRAAAAVAGIFLVAGLGALGGYFAGGPTWLPLAALVGAGLVPHSHSALVTRSRKNRRVLCSAVGALLILGTLGTGLIAVGDPRGVMLYQIYFFAWIGFMFLDGWLERR